MNPPEQHTETGGLAESGGEHEIKIVLVHDQPLIRDALVSLLESDRRFKVVEAVAKTEDAVACRAEPDIVLVAYGRESTIAEVVERLQAAFPVAKLLLLDDATNDGRVLLALRTNIRSYVTTRQSGPDILLAVRKTAAGERVFTPEIASRLSFTQEGVRLQRPTVEAPLSSLTPREREVMTYLSLGYTVKQTAQTLGLRPSTVDNHKTRLMKKLKVHKTVELTRLAFRYGLVASDSAAPLRDGEVSGGPEHSR